MKVIIMLVNINIVTLNKKYFDTPFRHFKRDICIYKKFLLSHLPIASRTHRVNCRVEMIESNYFIKLMVCGLSVSAESK